MIKLNIQLVSRCYTLFSLLRKYIFNCLIITTNRYCSVGRAALKTSTFRYKKRKRLMKKLKKLHSINLFSSILIFGLKVLNGASGQNRTADTRIFSPLLYRLSYRGKNKWRFGRDLNPRSPV